MSDQRPSELSNEELARWCDELATQHEVAAEENRYGLKASFTVEEKLNRDIAKRLRNLDTVTNDPLTVSASDLLDAAEQAQCDCSPKERESGHKVGCWFPALQYAIAKAKGQRQ